MGDKPRYPYDEKRDELNAIVVHARNVISKMSRFSFEEFERRYKTRSGRYTDVFEMFENHIQELKANGQVGTASTYQTALKSFKGYIGKGSGRSIPGINMYSALCQCSEYLIGFGGHPMAAGMSIKKENLKPFQERFNEVIETMSADHQFTPRMQIDCQLDFDVISDQLIDDLSLLQPFGQKNPEPVFSADKVDVSFSKIIAKKHRRMTLKQRSSVSKKTVNAIWFNVEETNRQVHFFKKIAFNLEKKVRKHLNAQKSNADKIRLDEKTIQKLKGLGYLN